MQEIKLSPEAEFSILAFAMRVKNLTHQQALVELVQLYSAMVAKEALYKAMMAQSLGLKT
jgi:hypothetical protein